MCLCVCPLGGAAEQGAAADGRITAEVPAATGEPGVCPPGASGDAVRTWHVQTWACKLVYISKQSVIDDDATRLRIVIVSEIRLLAKRSYHKLIGVRTCNAEKQENIQKGLHI